VGRHVPDGSPVGSSRGKGEPVVLPARARWREGSLETDPRARYRRSAAARAPELPIFSPARPHSSPPVEGLSEYFPHRFILALCISEPCWAGANSASAATCAGELGLL